MVQYKTGNLLEADVEYICHQVNCQGRMRSGIAKQIREKWPLVFDRYECWVDYHSSRGGPRALLGECQYIEVSPEQTVVNLFAQEHYGYDNRRYTSYDAFWSCLGQITKTVPKRSKIGFPYRIGCGLGGANWQVIETMIYAVLGKDYDVYIYVLEGEEK